MAAALVLLVSLLSSASATTHAERLDFVRKDVQQRGPDDFLWGAMAHDRGDLRRLWERYDQDGPLPTIRFKKNVAAVGGTGGSSSCPLRLDDLRLDHERRRIVIRMYLEDPGQDGACTDDWIPRTFTVSISRADLEPFRPRSLQVVSRRVDDPDG